MRIFIWIVFILSLRVSCETIFFPFIDWLQHGWGWGSSFIDWLQSPNYPGWVWGQEWDWRLTIIPYSLSITGFVYLFLGKGFGKMNKNQKRILAIFIPISIYFIAFIVASIVGFPGNPFDDYKRNPFYWRKTWYVWMFYLIFICIFEYKLFADKKKKNKEVGGK